MISASQKHIRDRRVIKEYTTIQENPLPNVKVVQEINDNLNWYCLLYDIAEEEYAGGEYIVNIKLSKEYPFTAPDFYILTPNGRFDTHKKLCFSNSSYHQESWSPVWNMKTIILGFLSFFLEKQSAGIGHIDTSKEVKMSLALASSAYNLEKNSHIMELFNM